MEVDNDYTHYFMYDAITHSRPNCNFFNGWVITWMSDYITYSYWAVMICSYQGCYRLSAEGGLGLHYMKHRQQYQIFDNIYILHI